MKTKIKILKIQKKKYEICYYKKVIRNLKKFHMNRNYEQELINIKYNKDKQNN